MKKQTKLKKDERKSLITAITNGKMLTPQQEHTLRALLPAWVPEKENIGTAMTQTATQFTVLIEELLVRYHGFDEKEIKKLEKEIKKILPVLAGTEVERDLSILNPRDMQKVADIAEKRYDRLDTADKLYFLGIKKALNSPKPKQLKGKN